MPPSYVQLLKKRRGTEHGRKARGSPGILHVNWALHCTEESDRVAEGFGEKEPESCAETDPSCYRQV